MTAITSGWTAFAAVAALVALLQAPPAASDQPWRVPFQDVADRAGLRTPTIYGGVERKRFIIETNGAGVALARLRRRRLARCLRARAARGCATARARTPWPRGKRPPTGSTATSRDGTFADVTDARGPAAHGLGLVGLRRRLRQRRPARPVRHLLRHERPVPQPRRRLRGRDARARACRRPGRAGDRAARSSTTTATAASTSSSRTTWPSTSRRRPSPARARTACGRASR